MNAQASSAEAVRRVALEGELGIYSVAKHHQPLLSELESGAELELDLAGVTELDSAGAQLLLVLKQEAEATGKQLRLVNHSQAVYEVLELLRLQARFGDPVVISADWTTA